MDQPDKRAFGPKRLHTGDGVEDLLEHPRDVWPSVVWPSEVWPSVVWPSDVWPSDVWPSRPAERAMRVVGGRASAKPVAPAPRYRPRSAAWQWGLAGFAVGIVFWHAIGFWGFVARIVWPAQEYRAHEIAGTVTPLALKPTKSGVVRPNVR